MNLIFDRRCCCRVANRALGPLLPGMVILASPAQASGPYVVDDAAITPAGEGQIETWVSLAAHGHVGVFAPAANFAAIPFAEWSVILDAGRLDGTGTRGLTAQLKLLPGASPEVAGEVGFSASGAVRIGLGGEGVTGFAVNTITTLAATNRLLLHGNIGWTRDALAETSALTWGARAELAAIPEKLALHAEVFGTSQTDAGVQIGLRPTVLGGERDLEFIVSHNLANERATWATIGLAVRF